MEVLYPSVIPHEKNSIKENIHSLVTSQHNAKHRYLVVTDVFGRDFKNSGSYPKWSKKAKN